MLRRGVERCGARTRRTRVAVLDLLLPRIDGGLAVLRISAARPELPVVILSAPLRPADEAARTSSWGANDYVVKPFSLDELIARIRVQLRMRQV